MTFAAPVQGFVIQPEVNLSRSNSCLGIARWRPRKGILARGSGSCTLLMTSWASSPITRRAEELTANQTSQEVDLDFSFTGQRCGPSCAP